MVRGTHLLLPVRTCTYAGGEGLIRNSNLGPLGPGPDALTARAKGHGCQQKENFNI
jgi:hypothetical protein